MQRDAYEVLSLLLRYPLTALAGLTLYLVAKGTVSSMIASARSKKRIGDSAKRVRLVVEMGVETVPIGAEFFIEREAVIGSSRRCDICLKHPSVARQHAQAVFTGDELLIRPVSRAEVTVSHAPAGPRCIAQHNDIISIGDIDLRVKFIDAEAEEAAGEQN